MIKKNEHLRNCNVASSCLPFQDIDFREQPISCYDSSLPNFAYLEHNLDDLDQRACDAPLC